MSSQICYFKEYEFIKHDANYFEFFKSEEELDESFTFRKYFDAQEAAEKLGLSDIFNYIIPYVRDLGPYVGLLEKKSIENILISPKECLALNEEYNLINKLIEENPDFQISLESVLNNWKKGRFVIVHYE